MLKYNNIVRLVHFLRVGLMETVRRVSNGVLGFFGGFLYLMEAIFFSLFNKFEFYKKDEPFFTKEEIKEIESGQIFIKEESKAKKFKAHHPPPKLIQ